MIKAILFDLDGTLLPMQQDEFTTAYLDALSKKLAAYGYEPHRLVGGVWQGTRAMVRNNGRQTNEQVFWKEFSDIFGDRVYSDIDKFNAFYESDFDGLKCCCGYNEQANQAVQALKEKGFTLALASNPVFPLVAQRKRMLWAGLYPDDFAIVTSYENSCYCKPNPLYFMSVAEKIGVKPSECLVVGNDTTEDEAATQIDMDFFLLTNCLLNRERKDISKYPRGSFMQLLNYVSAINDR